MLIIYSVVLKRINLDMLLTIFLHRTGLDGGKNIACQEFPHPPKDKKVYFSFLKF